MKYLTRVILENFQSHKYSVIEFKQGLNVIVGPSDTGKSAIIRAIKWALYNEPAGDYFIREGEKECSVSLEFSDQTKIKRLRSRSKNIYLLYDKDGDEIKFEGFGTSVPEEIVEAIGIRKIHLDSEESNAINLGEQLEGPFLLSEKTSTRASAIGRLIGVNIIDDALKDTLRDLRASSTMKKNLDENIELINQELDGYTYLDELSQKVNNIEKLTHLIRKKKSKLEKIQRIFKEYSDLQKNLRNVNKHINELQDVERLDKILKNISYLNNDYKYFNRKKEELTKYKLEINISSNVLNKLRQVSYIENMYRKLGVNYNRIQTMNNFKEQISFITEELNKMNYINTQLNELDIFENNIKKAENNIKKLIILNDFNQKMEQSRKNIGIGTIYTKKLKEVNNIFKIYEELKVKLKRLSTYKEYVGKLQRLQSTSYMENKTIKETNRNMEQVLENYKDLLRKLEVCPLCLSNIDNDKIQNIIQHYN